MTRSGCGLQRWLEHIEQVHFRSIDLTLDRVRRVAHVLGLPGHTRYVVVAGTNGKGSSVAYLESIYRSAGYTTGAYTSPHLVRYNERVRVDGFPVSDSLLEQAFAAVEAARHDIPLTYFEFGTLAALQVFRESSPDVVILEVGMGGRLDAVNIVDADVALITEIGLDHQLWLGDTIEKIAREKAGVMKYGGIAVTSGQAPPPILHQLARERRCDLWRIGVDYDFLPGEDTWSWTPSGTAHGDGVAIDDLPIPAGGVHQLRNAAGAIAVARRLDSLLPVEDWQIRRAIGQAWMPGRLQKMDGARSLLLDVSHNADGLSVLAQWLRDHRPRGAIHGVFSMLADKDIAASVQHVADLVDHWYIAPLDNPRAAETSMLSAAIAAVTTAPMNIADDIKVAVDVALAAAEPDDLVVVFGSFYAVGDIMRHLHLDPYPALG
jgi:dihydrofolate synthase / folylpolyglutamate synthase